MFQKVDILERLPEHFSECRIMLHNLFLELFIRFNIITFVFQNVYFMEQSKREALVGETGIFDIDAAFKQKISRAGMDKIDYLGINLTDEPHKAPVCKLYYSQDASDIAGHELAAFLRERNMLRYFETVEDMERPHSVRMDLALQKRNDANMDALYQYFEEKIPFFEPHADEVKAAAGMEITALPNHRYAANYHVGLIEEEGVISLLKFHFFTRWSKDPDRPGKEGYRDQMYLDYLRSLPIREYAALADKIAYLLEKCGGHLWMAGMDLASDVMKYKIYIKNSKGLYRFLPDIMEAHGKEQLRMAEDWNRSHSEWKLIGIALGLDTRGVATCNLYYCEK